MHLCAVTTAKELERVASSLLPMRVDLSKDPEGATRWLDVDRLLGSELIADKGLLLRATASLRWPDRSILDAITIKRLELLLTPRLVATAEGTGLSISLSVADLDLRWVPSFVDRVLLDRINTGLAEVSERICWDFSETLSVKFNETRSHTNIASIALDVSTAELCVDQHAISITGPMTVHIDRRPPAVLAGGPVPAALPPATDDPA